MKEGWNWYVYIVECLDDTFYTGMTWNVSERELQHRVGKGSKYTIEHGFRALVYYEEHDDLEVATYREIQIKDWSQAKKRKLISGEWKQEWNKASRLRPDKSGLHSKNKR